MTDGAAVLMSMIWGFRANGIWRDERGVNMLDTGAHFYDTYETSDGKWISIGSIEPQFYAELRRLAGLTEDKDFDAQMLMPEWPRLKEKLTALFKTKTRDEWCAPDGNDRRLLRPGAQHGRGPAATRTTPMRGTFIEVDGVMQPAPAPRYSVTQTATPPVMTRDHLPRRGDSRLRRRGARSSREPASLGRARSPSQD